MFGMTRNLLGPMTAFALKDDSQASRCNTASWTINAAGMSGITPEESAQLLQKWNLAEYREEDYENYQKLLMTTPPSNKKERNNGTQDRNNFKAFNIKNFPFKELNANRRWDMKICADKVGKSDCMSCCENNTYGQGLNYTTAFMNTDTCACSYDLLQSWDREFDLAQDGEEHYTLMTHFYGNNYCRSSVENPPSNQTGQNAHRNHPVVRFWDPHDNQNHHPDTTNLRLIGNNETTSTCNFKCLVDQWCLAYYKAEKNCYAFDDIKNFPIHFGSPQTVSGSSEEYPPDYLMGTPCVGEPYTKTKM